MNQSGRILIVDDEANLRHTVARVLQRAGFEVTTAASGKEGLALLSQQTFDLVYMDIRMPDMNGLETLQAITADHPKLPVILFTGQPDLHSAVSALRQGALDYLQKPLKPELIIERAKTVLSNLERERRKKELQAQIETLQAELRSLENEAGVELSSKDREANGNERYLKRGNLILDLHTQRVTVDNQVTDLSPTAFNYLLVLARHAPNVVDYQTLVTEAQGYQADAREAQDLSKWHVHQIRETIEPDAAHPTFIINVRGTGYRLVVD
ncbi:MAG TPA: response regulator transcription factor [Anaerolineales bacterium]|nr:response regulator transcription factor [Anaerolineales bacterium]